jgi:hypothetical protein
MWDVLMVVFTVAFFMVAVGYVKACAQLSSKR